MCVMEMFEKATFAQVPLRVTGDPARPVEVRPDADGDHKVGTSVLWRLGKKVPGFSPVSPEPKASSARYG
jgi:sulfide:quinone oxidoreductase